VSYIGKVLSPTAEVLYELRRFYQRRSFSVFNVACVASGWDVRYSADGDLICHDAAVSCAALWRALGVITKTHRDPTRCARNPTRRVKSDVRRWLGGMIDREVLGERLVCEAKDRFLFVRAEREARP
jgi:hypothetical protein